MLKIETCHNWGASDVSLLSLTPRSFTVAREERESALKIAGREWRKRMNIKKIIKDKIKGGGEKSLKKSRQLKIFFFCTVTDLISWHEISQCSEQRHNSHPFSGWRSQWMSGIFQRRHLRTSRGAVGEDPPFLFVDTREGDLLQKGFCSRFTDKFS